MPTPATEAHPQIWTLTAAFRVPDHLFCAHLLLAAGLLLFCQYPGVASAQARTPSPPAPLPVQAPTASESDQAESPAPDVWSESEIADARRICTTALKSVHAKIEELPPIKNGPCGSPAPVRLISIGKNNPVKFKPAPTISCRMLVPLNQWIERGLQPAAALHLDTRVTAVSIMSSYSCRTRYGRKGARMSEHAFANALDIGGFHLASDNRVSVLQHWGLTKRDIAKAVAAAKEEKRQAELLKTAKAEPTEAPVLPEISQRKQRRSPPVAPEAKVRPTLPEVRIDKRRATQHAEERRLKRRENEQRRAALAARIPPPLDRPLRRVTSQREPRQSTGSVGGAFGAAAPSVLLPPLPVRRPLRRAVGSNASYVPSSRSLQEASPRTAPSAGDRFKAPYRLGGPKVETPTPRSSFLRTIHSSACRIFGTTLGPEANEAHRNHFHFDMFPRRRRGYCE